MASQWRRSFSRDRLHHRGGLVPAAIVARELGIRVIETVCISSYGHDNKQGALQVLKGIAADVANGDGGEKVLVIDDLVDTGATAKLVREMMPKAHFATVYAKPQGRPMVDTFITEVSQDTWIFFRGILHWPSVLRSTVRASSDTAQA